MEKNPSLAQLTPDATLSQIISTDRKAGELLASIGINPSNHKDQSLRSVCQQRQWSEVEVLKWVKKQRRADKAKTAEEKSETPDFGRNALRWCEYLEDKFNSVNLELLQDIREHFPRVHQIHGNQYTWLKNMQWHFERFEEALTMYYEFEENRFFPLVDILQNNQGDLLHGTIRKLERCMAIVDKDQKRLNDLMGSLYSHGNSFKNPGGACSTLRILNQNFKTLFASLERQFEIEREALLPAIQIMIRDKQ